MKGRIWWNLRISGVERYTYLMFLFREIDKKLCKNYTKTDICQIFIKVVALNRLYSTITQPIWKLYHNQGRIQGGRGNIRHPLTDIMWGVAPPEFGIFCSYFQNSFSTGCLRERNPSVKQEKYLSLVINLYSFWVF